MTTVGGLCRYTICKFSRSEYFLVDIMHVMITKSEAHHSAVVTQSDAAAENVDLPNLCL